MTDTTDTTESLATNPEGEVKMTIWEHLGELRTRVVRAALGVVAGAIGCWTYRVELLAWLTAPYLKQWKVRFPSTPLELQTLAPADAFVNYMQLSLVGGLVMSAPIIFYQLWAFISPGLYAKEKRYIIPFVFFSSSLFLSGVAFAYYAAFPFMFRYLLSQVGQVGSSDTILTSRPTMEYYVDFATRTLLAFGFVFELPIFISFLAIAGIVTPRQLLRWWRWAIVASVLVGAIVTPGPEITSQLVVAAALVALYFLSVGVAFIVGKKKPEETAQDKA
jgi:sec-independent protein translocase protein TatC